MKVFCLDILKPGADPTITLMADSAVRPDRRPLFAADTSTADMCQIRAAVRIDRLGKCVAPKFADRYHGHWSLACLTRPATFDPADSTWAWTDDALVLGQWIESAQTDPSAGVECSHNLCVTIDPAQVTEAIVSITARATVKTGDVILLPTPLITFPPVIGTQIDIHTIHDNKPIIQFNIK